MWQLVLGEEVQRSCCRAEIGHGMDELFFKCYTIWTWLFAAQDSYHIPGRGPKRVPGVQVCRKRAEDVLRIARPNTGTLNTCTRRAGNR